jgi:molybdopterin-containing oxidoreductase family iron-sulfur binding subunit
MSQIDDENILSREFDGPPDLSQMDRRDFMRTLGLFSSMTLLSHCSKKADHIVPFVKEAEEFSIHNFEYYTSAFPVQGFAQGILVKSFQGRPIKVEGNPLHPESLGATTAQAQAILFDLYHPERLKDFIWKGKKVSSVQAKQYLRELMASHHQGENSVLIFPSVHSPTLVRLLKVLKKKLPKLKVMTLSPWHEEYATTFDLQEVERVFSFDEDLFFGRPDSLRLSREWMDKKRRGIEANKQGSLPVMRMLESRPTLMGAKSDTILRLRPSDIWNEATELLAILEKKSSGSERMKGWSNEIMSHPSIVTINHDLHPRAQELERKINSVLKKNFARTYRSELPNDVSSDELKAGLKSKKFETVIVLDSDPVYWDPEFRELFKNATNRVSISLYENETYALCESKFPLSHLLEAWGDLYSMDGAVTLQQPLINPLYSSVSMLEFLQLLIGEEKTSLPIVQETWKSKGEESWHKALKEGIIQTDRRVESKPGVNPNFEKLSGKKWELKITPDFALLYGEYAQNPILQELPRPFTRHTWTNVLVLSEKKSRELKIKCGDIVRLKTSKKTLEIPAFPYPLMPENGLWLTLGGGLEAGTSIGKNHGINAFALKGSEVLSLERTWKSKKLALIQEDMDMEGSHAVKLDSLPLKSEKKVENQASFYPRHPIPAQNEGPQYGMTIDLTTCIGCEACVSACQVENNIPFVGEDQVRKKRALHWLRIDHYIKDETVLFQPVPCMHCEKAPCEVVCPVNATVHGNGGLNEMVYNRCVGTRYCSNNCPYKVRRFNFKAYSALKTPWNLGLNPDVSVRDRGVMEKCTYCIQRIKFGERNGSEVKTACQQVCPTNAIVFGDIKDEKTLVSVQKKSLRNYDLLEEEGTRPRTSYLKVIRINDEQRRT